MTENGPKSVENIGLLSEQSRPFAISILGDNTTKSSGGWVYLVAQWIAAEYGRTVTLRSWSFESEQYSEPVVVGEGIGAPVEIWNGGTPARNIAFSIENLPKLTESLPEVVDLFFLSHGHNEGNRTLAKASMDLVTKFLALRPSAVPVVILQNAERRDLASSKLHELNMLDLKTSAKIRGLASIDVYSETEDGSRGLLDSSGVFPNAPGFVVWARAVEAHLRR